MKRKFLTAFRESQSLLLLTTGMANNKKDIKERLKLIARRPKMLKITVICLAILMIAICVVACTNALPDDKGEDTPISESAPAETEAPIVTYDNQNKIKLDESQISSFFTMNKEEILELLGDGYEIVYFEDIPASYRYKDLGLSFNFYRENPQKLAVIEPIVIDTNDYICSSELFQIYGLNSGMNFNQIEQILGEGERRGPNGGPSVDPMLRYSLVYEKSNYILAFTSDDKDGSNALTYCRDNYTFSWIDAFKSKFGIDISIPEGWTIEGVSEKSFTDPQLTRLSFIINDSTIMNAEKFGTMLFDTTKEVSVKGNTHVDNGATLKTFTDATQYKGFSTWVFTLSDNPINSYTIRVHWQDNDRVTVSIIQDESDASIYSLSLEDHKAAPLPDESIIKEVKIARHVTAYYDIDKKTASDTYPRIGTVACNLNIPGLEKGTKIYVPGYGYGIVEDEYLSSNEDNLDLDLFFGNGSEAEESAMKWGRKSNLEFYILKS